MAARVGFEPATLQMQGTEPTTEPPCPILTLAVPAHSSVMGCGTKVKICHVMVICSGFNTDCTTVYILLNRLRPLLCYYAILFTCYNLLTNRRMNYILSDHLSDLGQGDQTRLPHPDYDS